MTTYRLFLLSAASWSVRLVEHVSLDSGRVDGIYPYATGTDGYKKKMIIIMLNYSTQLDVCYTQLTTI